VILICAAFFYFAASLLAAGCGMARKERAGARGVQAALIVLLPAAAFLTDRSAIVLAPLALLGALLVVRKANARFVVPGVLAGAIAAILAAYFIAVQYPVEVERIMQNVIYVFKGSGKLLPGLLAFQFSPSNFGRSSPMDFF